MPQEYRFSFGPWNIHEGADPFGPSVRESLPFHEKLKMYKELGFDGVQFHDDDAVPDLNNLTAKQIAEKAKQLGTMLEDHGLVAELVAPRLWEDPRTIDGAYTSNDPDSRAYAGERSRITIDIANILDTRLIVLWLAREGTYIREAKEPAKAVDQLVEAINDMLAYDPNIRIAIEPKPNEPMDLSYIPTVGHAVALSYMTDEPDRVGVNMESAHAILAGLDPADEMGFALARNKLFTVHLNDQNGLKFDEDKAFGSVNLRRAFNQVAVLERNNYGRNGEFIGLDVKAMRTQKAEVATKHLRNSRAMFLRMVELVRSLDDQAVQGYISQRDYEELEALILNHLLGKN
ncbi:MAG: TIM barrel protein [Calditrichota bacterium]